MSLQLRLDHFSDRAAAVAALNRARGQHIKAKGWHAELTTPTNLFVLVHTYTYNLKRVGVLRDVEVWTVDGGVVRNGIDVDFTMGGSDARYAYVPNNDIWIDRVLGAADATATVLHEFIERTLMKNDGLSYGDAHDIATEHESVFRQTHRDGKRINLRAVERYLRLHPESLIA